MAAGSQQKSAHNVPHHAALGLDFVEGGSGSVTMSLPYDEKLVGNPETGVLHGGAITALMDAASGAAAFIKVASNVRIATLDLRIDYLRPATPHEPVHARATCFKATHNVAFVRCEAYHPHDRDDLIAVANGTFMIFRDDTRHHRGGS